MQAAVALVLFAWLAAAAEARPAAVSARCQEDVGELWSLTESAEGRLYALSRGLGAVELVGDAWRPAGIAPPEGTQLTSLAMLGNEKIAVVNRNRRAEIWRGRSDWRQASLPQGCDRDTRSFVVGTDLYLSCGTQVCRVDPGLLHCQETGSDGPVVALTGDGRELWAAAGYALFHFDGAAWRPVSVPEPPVRFTALAYAAGSLYALDVAAVVHTWAADQGWTRDERLTRRRDFATELRTLAARAGELIVAGSETWRRRAGEWSLIGPAPIDGHGVATGNIEATWILDDETLLWVERDSEGSLQTRRRRRGVVELIGTFVADPVSGDRGYDPTLVAGRWIAAAFGNRVVALDLESRQVGDLWPGAGYVYGMVGGETHALLAVMVAGVPSGIEVHTIDLVSKARTKVAAADRQFHLVSVTPKGVVAADTGDRPWLRRLSPGRKEPVAPFSQLYPFARGGQLYWEEASRRADCPWCPPPRYRTAPVDGGAASDHPGGMPLGDLAIVSYGRGLRWVDAAGACVDQVVLGQQLRFGTWQFRALASGRTWMVATDPGRIWEAELPR